MKTDELINGKIYYFRTGYEWVVRFKEILSECIIGYGNAQNKNFGRNYSNKISIHREIREANKEEIQLYEKLEKDRPIIADINNLLIFN